jgi:stress response protein YsnF
MKTENMLRREVSDSPHRLISSERVDGTDVYNQQGEKLGTIDHLMIDKFSGHVAYALMSFGGFLGVGESYHPLPWEALDYDVNLEGYVVDVDRDRLENAPRYTASTQPNWSDRAYAQTVDKHWGVSRQREDRIVVAFENTERARAAREALIGEGIDNARMELLDNASGSDHWAAIRQHSVPDEDAHLYAEAMSRGHALLVIRPNSGEYDRVMQVITRFNPIDIDKHADQWRKAGWSGVHPGKATWDVRRQSDRRSATASGATGTEEEVIPVYEEELRVGKRAIEGGHVRVRVYTVEKPVREGVTLREERVAVERRPVARPVSGVPDEAFRERTIDVTTHREEPVVSKEARVKEEVVVRKEADQRTETVQGTARRSKVEIDDDRTKTTAAPASTTTKPKP